MKSRSNKFGSYLGKRQKCEGGADSIGIASDARNGNDTRRRIARAGRCGPSKGVEKVGRKVFRIYQMYAVFRLGVVHLIKLLGFFLDESWSNVLGCWHAVCFINLAETTLLGVVFPF